MHPANLPWHPGSLLLRRAIQVIILRSAAEDCFCDQFRDRRKDNLDVILVGVGAKIVVDDDLRFHRHRTFLGTGTMTGFSQHTQYPKALWKAIDKDTEKTVSKLVILST